MNERIRNRREEIKAMCEAELPGPTRDRRHAAYRADLQWCIRMAARPMTEAELAHLESEFELKVGARLRGIASQRERYDLAMSGVFGDPEPRPTTDAAMTAEASARVAKLAEIRLQCEARISALTGQRGSAAERAELRALLRALANFDRTMAAYERIVERFERSQGARIRAEQEEAELSRQHWETFDRFCDSARAERAEAERDQAARQQDETGDS